MTRQALLALVPAGKARGGGQPSGDDYDVLDADRRVVGRVFRAPKAPPYRAWCWMINARVDPLPTESGYAGTREDAMEAFRRAWSAGLPTPESGEDGE